MLPRDLQIVILKSYLRDSERTPQIFDPLIALFDVRGGKCDTSVLREVLEESDVNQFVCRVIDLGAVRLLRKVLPFSEAEDARAILMHALENSYLRRDHFMLIPAAAHFMRDGKSHGVWDHVMKYPGILGLIVAEFDEGLRLLVTLLRVPRFRRCLSQETLDSALYGICSGPLYRYSNIPEYPELLEECNRLLLGAGADTGVFYKKAIHQRK